MAEVFHEGSGEKMALSKLSKRRRLLIKYLPVEEMVDESFKCSGEK